MTSRLAKAMRRVFGTPSVSNPPKVLAGDYARDGHIVSLTHQFYGPLRLLADDEGISAHIFNGVTVWEPSIVKLFAKEFQSGRNVIDLGANLGLHSIALSKLARQGERVYAFEPHPDLFSLLKYNCEGCTNVHCINKAASDTSRTFYMPSVLGASNSGGFSVLDTAVAGAYPVEAVTIDSLELVNVGLMKIDTEGHELECIRGAAETIRRDKPTLIVEICGGHSLSTAPPDIVREINHRIAEICAMGYSVSPYSDHDYLFHPK
jgi:FkbM family methyltransferase